MSFRAKAELLVVACLGIFGLNAGFVYWVQRFHRDEFVSSPGYQSFLAYRALFLKPFMAVPLFVLVLLCGLKMYKNQQQQPVNEREQLYLLALLCGTVLGAILLSASKL